MRQTECEVTVKINISLYPKEADFHLRQGVTLLQPSETNLPGFSVTSTGRDVCLLQKDTLCYKKTNKKKQKCGTCKDRYDRNIFKMK